MRFAKKLFEGKDIEVVLQRLDRLTQDEAQTSAAEILRAIYGLVQNMDVVMSGEQTHSARHLPFVEIFLSRREAIC